MSIREFETEEQLDDAFELEMEIMQKDQKLRDLIYEAKERVSSARDELNEAEDELMILKEELDSLGL